MRYQFDKFVLDLERFELSRDSVPVELEPQVLELLALLVANAQRVVSREEINREVWKGRVVSEAALSSRIKVLRHALGDSGRNQRFIRTVRKKGFRFVAPVGRAEEDAAQGSGVPAAEHADAPRPADPVSDADPAAHPAAGAARISVAVLPFRNLSGEVGHEYFADGMTADLITHLSKHHGLAVTARNTSFGYKGRNLSGRDVGRELDVSYVVEGSVQRSQDRVRINAYLVDARTGYHAWAERYDRRIEDIFSLQDEITEKIVARVEPEIGYAERTRVLNAHPRNLQAWDLFQLGVYHFFQFRSDDNLEAQRLLQRSWELDPHFGEAYAWWAYALTLGMVYWDTRPSAALLDRALAACDKALSLDGRNAVFHALKARVLLARREYGRAIAENEAAIALNPTLAAAHCGLGDSLAYEGRYEDALACFRRAIELSPNDPQRWAFFTYGALALLFKGEYAAALDWTARARTIPNCQYWTAAHQAVALACLGRGGEARRAVGELLREKPGFSVEFARQKLFYLKRSDQIDAYLEGLRLAGVPESSAAAPVDDGRAQH